MIIHSPESEVKSVDIMLNLLAKKRTLGISKKHTSKSIYNRNVLI